MKAILGKGEKHIIFEDPITQEKEEGKATLVEFLGFRTYSLDSILERWSVHFDGDYPDELYQRVILVKHNGKVNK